MKNRLCSTSMLVLKGGSRGGEDWLEAPEYVGKSQEDLKAWTLQDLGEVKDLLQRSIIQQLT